MTFAPKYIPISGIEKSVRGRRFESPQHKLDRDESSQRCTLRSKFLHGGGGWVDVLECATARSRFTLLEDLKKMLMAADVQFMEDVTTVLESTAIVKTIDWSVLPIPWFCGKCDHSFIPMSMSLHHLAMDAMFLVILFQISRFEQTYEMSYLCFDVMLRSRNGKPMESIP